MNGLIDLVIIALTNKDKLNVLYDYFVLNQSPSTIAYKRKLKILTVKSWINRSRSVDKNILKSYIDKLIKLDSVFDGHKCKLCGAKIEVNKSKHLREKHMSYVNRLVESITY